ncbi:MAG: YhfC family intramembrane metalloprotease [Clostridiales bacterium]|jgi:uncharacterized membrane protein YhfC|nr:YhfC family intramembrane metalloprotease [Clostridiales bacterium]
MAVSALMAFGIPIALYAALRRRFSLKFVPALAGAAVFVVFVLILESAMHRMILNPDADGNIALMANPVLFVTYAALAAGAYEELGRLAAMWLLRRKDRYTGPGTAIAYGIGHGGIESILVAGLTMIATIIMSVMINGGYSDVLGTAETVAESAAILAGTPPAMFLASGFERILAVGIHLSLSVVVWAALEKNKWYLVPAAVLVHALCDVPAAMLQCGVYDDVLIAEALTTVMAVLTALFGIWVWKTFGIGSETDSAAGTESEQ